MSDVAEHWWEICEWTAQDAERTMLHAEQFCELWMSDLGDIEHDDGGDIEGSVERLGQLTSAWKTGSRPVVELAADVFEQLTVIAEHRSRNGDVVPTHVGSVERINVSRGGVPKTAVDGATVGWRGIDGDVQATRQHHGRPWQALCLWSADVIDTLSADGHPVTAGGAGENLTLRGVEWGALRGGTIIDIGSVRCQLTAPAVPCSKTASNFTDRDISLIDHGLHPDQCRWYAAVVQPGRITHGDAVTVSPPST